MRRLFHIGLFLTLLLVSCSPQPARVAEPTSIPTPTLAPVVAHAPEIRFALVGEPQTVNVWQLFDTPGASYADYALRADSWPRLYHLLPPEFTFEPLAASGLPTAFTQENDFYVAAVKLRTDLKWTDGSAFTAEDVAFTVNAALAFELGFDWSEFYPSDDLHHAEALDASTVKYYFKQEPNVGAWQYGALQGPVVQKAFWEGAVNAAANSLPTETLRTEIAKTQADLETVKRDVAELSEQVLALILSGKQNRILDSDLKRKQNEQIFVQSNLDRLLEEYAANIAAAQSALYASSDEKEPLLGSWIPLGMEDGQWVNEANLEFPFIQPGFDRAVYKIFESETEALTAFENGEVDAILAPAGISSNIPGMVYSSTYSARFLVFNPLKMQFADPAFHSALSCMLDRNTLSSDRLQNQAFPFDAFVLSPQWHDPAAQDPCTGLDEATRIGQAVKFMKDAGYFWAKEPDANGAGQGLRYSNGDLFPTAVLLSPTKDEDPLRYAAANYVSERAEYLGVSITVQTASMDDLIYAVYSSQQYDLAITGWRLSEYPAYLCEMFDGRSQHLYTSDRFQSACDALKGESDLERARQGFRQIESALMMELPFIPLFTVARADLYQKIAYPAEKVLNSWGGLYGAPSFAVPLP
ncbi:MAG TPA: ABC transporter substrate-binding protein, partial [Anaerolineales bacterium]|nr:ABC transporter substrate-binding protein [Anaerolineales bacterium]HMX74813.1 ABC transporter substrate-binding protein [Anaerolineales bacterium]HNH03817.1 ABC transporter substrate-binding protein [Anaerolineales bacterium]